MADEEAFNQDSTDCAICMEVLEKAKACQTPCKHLFCTECILDWLSQNTICPLCRTKVETSQLLKPKSDDIKENEKNKDKEKEKEESVESGKSKSNNMFENNENVHFSAKMDFLVKELKKLKKENPKDKVLVFTLFNSCISGIESRFKKENIMFKTLRSSFTAIRRKKQLQEFQTDQSAQVFILPVRACACGITLTAANHIYMMEAPLSPALFKQAVNRIYRLGQTKKCYITSIVMKNSIDEKLQQINVNMQKDDLQCNDIRTGALATDTGKHSKIGVNEIDSLLQNSE